MKMQNHHSGYRGCHTFDRRRAETFFNLTIYNYYICDMTKFVCYLRTDVSMIKHQIKVKVHMQCHIFCCQIDRKHIFKKGKTLF